MRQSSDTKQQPWLHERYQMRRCQCGECVTWEWDYKRLCWTTAHTCRWQQPVKPPTPTAQGQR